MDKPRLTSRSFKFTQGKGGVIPTQASPRGSASTGGAPYRVDASVHRPDANWPGLACCSRGAPCAAGHRARESVWQAEWLSGPEGVARTSTRARARRPRLWERGCGLAGDPCKTTRPAAVTLGTPSRPQPGGGGASTGGQAAASPPTSQSNWRQTGGGGDARESPAY